MNQRCCNFSAEDSESLSLKNWGKYDVIIWNGHGSYTNDLHSVLCLTIPQSEKFEKKYAADIKDHRLAFTEDSYCVTSRFFEHYYNDDSMNDSLIYLGACATAKDNVLADMLIRKGAATVFGYDNTVTPYYNNLMAEALFGELVYEPMAVTTKLALECAKIAVAPFDPGHFLLHYSQLYYAIYLRDPTLAKLCLIGDENYTLDHGSIAYGICGTCGWVIDKKGTLTIAPVAGKKTGKLPKPENDNDEIDYPWYEYRDKIKSVIVKDQVVAYDCSYMFTDMTNVTKMDLSGLDTGSVTAMTNMFCGCNSITKLDLSNFKTENVYDMWNMFAECFDLRYLDISGFNISGHEVMTEDMFAECHMLSTLKMGDWSVPDGHEHEGCATFPTTMYDKTDHNKRYNEGSYIPHVKYHTYID